MKILTYGNSHDANWMYYDSNTKELFYFMVEREYNTKNATIRDTDIIKVAQQYFGFDKKNPEHIIIGWAHAYQPFVDKTKVECEPNALYKQIGKNVYTVDHHYAHILSSLSVNDKCDIGISIDGKGNHKRRILIARNLHNLNETQFIIPEGNPPIGKLFSLFCEKLNLKYNDLTMTDFIIKYQWDVGKVMGLQSYGKVNKDFYNVLSLIPFKDTELDTFEKIFKKYLSSINVYNSQDNFDNVTTIYQFLCDKIIELFNQYFINDKDKNIAYGGGCALSTVANEKLLEEGYKITICPAANDSGLSIGLMKFADLYFNLHIDFSNIVYKSWTNDQANFINESQIQFIANQLNAGKIVALCYGPGEVGPRALGHRSILMNPAIANGKNYINEKVKHREWWRPFGGSIIDTKVINNYKASDLDYYMLRNFKIKDEWKEKLNAITHIDGSSRLQILKDTNEPLYKIIKAFNEISGIPALLNTSFNIAGRPIPNYKKHIFETFKVLDNIDYLIYNDKIYVKANDCCVTEATIKGNYISYKIPNSIINNNSNDVGD